jgi:hypothetical protein
MAWRLTRNERKGEGGRTEEAEKAEKAEGVLGYSQMTSWNSVSPVVSIRLR